MKYFVLVMFFFTISCSSGVKNCKIAPDLERIGESALENKDNLAETEIRSGKIACDF